MILYRGESSCGLVLEGHKGGNRVLGILLCPHVMLLLYCRVAFICPTFIRFEATVFLPECSDPAAHPQYPPHLAVLDDALIVVAHQNVPRPDSAHAAVSRHRLRPLSTLAESILYA